LNRSPEHRRSSYRRAVGTPRQQEEPAEPLKPEVVESQQEESPEPREEELAEPQPEEDVVHSQGDSNDLSDYTSLSDPDDSNSDPEPVRAANEFRSYG
jgi:hypothetical protein